MYFLEYFFVIQCFNICALVFGICFVLQEEIKVVTLNDYEKNNFPNRKNCSVSYNDINLFCCYLCGRVFRIGKYVPELKV
jgi:hypothetical protein